MNNILVEELNLKLKVGHAVCFDFDGVIHEGYKGWKDGSIYGHINYILLYFMKELMKDYYVVISSNRPAQQIVDYLSNDPKAKFVKFEVFHKDLERQYVLAKR